jgi:hypothetical protein
MALVEHQDLRVTRRLNWSASFYLTSPRMHDVRASLVPFSGKSFPSADANANRLTANGLMSVRNRVRSCDLPGGSRTDHLFG